MYEWESTRIKEVEAKDTSKFTRQSKKLAEELQNKSAITDHVTRENHCDRLGSGEGDRARI